MNRRSVIAAACIAFTLCLPIGIGVAGLLIIWSESRIPSRADIQMYVTAALVGLIASVATGSVLTALLLRLGDQVWSRVRLPLAFLGTGVLTGTLALPFLLVGNMTGLEVALAFAAVTVLAAIFAAVVERSTRPM